MKWEITTRGRGWWKPTNFSLCPINLRQNVNILAVSLRVHALFCRNKPPTGGETPAPGPRPQLLPANTNLQIMFQDPRKWKDVTEKPNVHPHPHSWTWPSRKILPVNDTMDCQSCSLFCTPVHCLLYSVAWPSLRKSYEVHIIACQDMCRNAPSSQLQACGRFSMTSGTWKVWVHLLKPLKTKGRAAASWSNFSNTTDVRARWQSELQSAGNVMKSKGAVCLWLVFEEEANGSSHFLSLFFFLKSPSRIDNIWMSSRLRLHVCKCSRSSTFIYTCCYIMLTSNKVVLCSAGSDEGRSWRWPPCSWELLCWWTTRKLFSFLSPGSKRVQML